MPRRLAPLVAVSFVFACGDRPLGDEHLVGPVMSSDVSSARAIGPAPMAQPGATAIAAGAALPNARIFWLQSKAAFRAGVADGNEWDEGNVGDRSIATGHGTIASGLNSAALGNASMATGDHSTAMGVGTNASGESSTAMGFYTQASGVNSTALGSRSIASGLQSTAMGFGTTAQAYGSTALGRCNEAAGEPESWVMTDPLLTVGNGGATQFLCITKANALTLLKNGNLGLGTDAPQKRLHIKSDAMERQIRLEDPSGIFDLMSSGNHFHIVQDATPRLTIVGATGNVGIGDVAISDKLTVGGDIRVGVGTIGCVKDADGTVIAGTCSSDARLKKNITSLPRLLENVTQLRPVSFNWRSDGFPDRALGEEPQIGLIAQEVERVMPELVVEGEDGFKQVWYSDVPMLLLQAVRELKAQKDAEIADLRALVAGLSATVEHLQAVVAGTRQ